MFEDVQIRSSQLLAPDTRDAQTLEGHLTFDRRFGREGFCYLKIYNLFIFIEKNKNIKIISFLAYYSIVKALELRSHLIETSGLQHRVEDEEEATFCVGVHL